MNNKYNFSITDNTIDFSRYWQECVGSGHAALGLREDWQRHLKFVRDELGFKFVRAHGLLDDDMYVLTSAKDLLSLLPKSIYTQSFYQIDILFDYILSIGMKPFVELSFMPKLMASGKRTIFFYKGNITPPKSYEKWGKLISDLIEHLIDRYGKEEVEKWYFEVWNEPNLSIFWKGSQKEYFKLYAYAAKAIKSIDPKIRVGGPSTAANEWIEDIIEYSSENNVPLDFISTHQYPADAIGHSLYIGMIKKYLKIRRSSIGKSVQNFCEKLFDSPENLSNAGRGVVTKYTTKARKEAGNYPLFYTEWNSNATCTSPVNDAPYNAGFIIKSIVDLQGMVQMYSFWTFSDIFEELNFFSEPFNGSFGMLTIHGIPKPSFWGFKMLSKLGDERIDLPTTCDSPTLEMVATKKENSIQILLYNHQVPLKPIEKESVGIEIEGINAIKEVTIERIDEDHGNPKKFWIEMGSPDYLKPEEVEDIKEKSKVIPENLEFSIENDILKINLIIPEQGVALISLNGIN